jgi:hypothetical protein
MLETTPIVLEQMERSVAAWGVEDLELYFFSVDIARTNGLHPYVKAEGGSKYR